METADRRSRRRRFFLSAVGGVLLASGAAAGCGSCGDSNNRNDPNSHAEGDPQPSSGRHRPFRLRWDGGRHRRHPAGEGGAAAAPDGEGGAPAE
jgi:hypothetical protein